MSESEEFEVSDDYFFQHLLDDDDDEVALPNWNDRLLATPEKAAVTTLSNMHSSDKETGTDSPASTVAEVVTDQVPHAPGTNATRCSIDEAWNFYAARKSKATVVNCHLQCDFCIDGGMLGIPIGDDSYGNTHHNTEIWYPSDLIAGFCSLVAHDAHTDVLPQAPYQSDHRIMMVYCPYPNGEIKEVLPIHDNATHFVSVVFNASHFAVLYYDIKARSVSVFDGLDSSIKNWEKHIVRTVKEYGLKPIVSKVKSKFRNEMNVVDGNVHDKMIMEIDFYDGEAPWIVKNERQYRQRDGYNCGPIAMLKVLEIYGWIKGGAIEMIANTPAGYRGFVMNFYDDMIKKYNDTLVAELRLHLVNNEIEIHPLGATATEKETETVVQSLDIDSAVESGDAVEGSLEIANAVEGGDAVEGSQEMDNAVAGSDAVDDTADNAEYCDDVQESANDNVVQIGYHGKDVMMDEVVDVVMNKHALTTNADDAVIDEVVEQVTRTDDDAVEGDVHPEVMLSDEDEPLSNTESASTDSIRAKSMEMRNKRQEQSAMKAIKQFGKEAINAGAGIGAVVTLKVDFRTHSHANGLLAVIYDVKEGTGGILVCCEHGVITHSGTKGDYWVPYNMYKVVVKRGDNVPLTEAMMALRVKVLMGQYVPEDQKRISYAKLHDITIHTTSPAKRGKGCSCRKGCKKSCGCKKNGYTCHSGCFCNGNCDGN